MSDKSLMDAIEDLLSESIADDINKITADNVKDGANLKPVGDKSSPDTQGVLGNTSGTALDAGGDKDVGPSGKKGHFPSQASSDTQGVLGTTSGAAMDAGGDTDVGGSKGDNPSDASADTQGVEGKTTGAALDAGGDKDVGKLKEDDEVETEDTIEEEVDLDEDWSFIDEETGEELSEEEVDEFAEWVVDNYELDEDLEEMMLGSKAGTKQSKSHIMKKAISRQAGSGPDGNKKVSLAGPGGKKITATKTNSTEPGKRYTTEDYSDIEFTQEDIQQLVDEGFDLDEIMEFFETEELEEKIAGNTGMKGKGKHDTGGHVGGEKRTSAKNFTPTTQSNKQTKSGEAAVKKAEAGAKSAVSDKTARLKAARLAAQKNEEVDLDEISMDLAKKTAKARDEKGYGLRNKSSTFAFQGDDAEKHADHLMKQAGKHWDKANKTKAIIKKREGQNEELQMRIEAMCASKKKMKEETVAEAEQPEAVGGKSYEDANKQYRPEQEKDVNPKPHGAGDPMGSTTGAALDAGGDKDAAPAGKKGEYPSEASSDTQGVLGKTKGAALDAGGDKDVGKLKEDEDELEEKLSGDQHKLDHNDNNKIDASDMKMVRKKGATAHLNKEEAEEEVDEDEGLTEDFKARAEVIFEAAVGEKVSMLREEMEAEYATKIEEETARLNEQVAAYVEEAVAEWLQENALEVRYSLRTEIAEGFMKGLKGLFQESYIEIPEEDASVVDELTEAVEEQRDTISTLEEELKESKKFILETRRKEVVAQLTEDLTATQAVRLEKLAENLEAADVEEFKGKVEKLKEGYFDPTNEQPLIGSLSEEIMTGEQFIAEDDESSVSQYAKFLSKTVL